MKNKNASFGGEGNGGVILKDIHLGRDSLVATIMILNMLAKENKTLDQIMTNIPNYYMIKEKVDIPNINVSSFYTYLSNIYNKSQKDTTDGLKLLWQDKWLHIRSSNTEPVIRIIAESKNLETTKKLIQDTTNQLKKYCLEN